MDRSKEYLLTLLNAYLKGDTVELAEDVDYTRLVALARCHNLCPTVFCVIKNATNHSIVPQDAYQELENSFFDGIYAHTQQSAAYANISRILCDSSIRYVPFKGIMLRELYPVPEARVMGDIDILIATQDRDKAQTMLTAGGLQLDKAGGTVQEYFCDGIKLELHTKIINDSFGGHDLGAMFADAMDTAVFGDSMEGRLDDNTHFAYLIAHIAHHFWFYGAGAKMILDLAVMLSSRSIDIDRAIDTLESQKLGEFAKLMLTICHQWFGVGRDYGMDTQDTQDTQEFLLSYGAFGNMNRNKAAVVQRKELEQGKTNPDSRLRLLLPPYSRMRELPYISFLDGRPYLLPAAWVYRVVYNIKNRRHFVMDTVANMGSESTNQEAKEELAYFQKIGLL